MLLIEEGRARRLDELDEWTRKPACRGTIAGPGSGFPGNLYLGSPLYKVVNSPIMEVTENKVYTKGFIRTGEHKHNNRSISRIKRTSLARVLVL